jgi:GNAT superfamily N-acetyltransferase
MSNLTVGDIRITSDKALVSARDLLELYISLDWMKPADDALARVTAVLERTDGVVGAFDPDGTLVGFVKILSDGDLYTTVAEILVRPEQQRRGIGMAMMDRVRTDWGHTPIFMAAFSYNQEFFEKCGYRTRENMIVSSKWFGRTPVQS